MADEAPAEAPAEGAAEAPPEGEAATDAAPQEGAEGDEEGEEGEFGDEGVFGEEEAEDEEEGEGGEEAFGEPAAEGAAPAPDEVQKEPEVPELTESQKALTAEPAPVEAAKDVAAKPSKTTSRFSAMMMSRTSSMRMAKSSKMSLGDRSICSGSRVKVVGSVISVRMGSTIGGLSGVGRTARYMNSYKLDSDNPFKPEVVEKILQEVMIEALENLTYDPDKCPKQAKWATSAIRGKVKEQEFDRYKIVCIVSIGEKKSQDLICVMKFLWDAERDRYATFYHDNMSVYGYACCLGFYYE